MQKSATWFKVWFDSPYYHLLYKHRDRSEAGRFIAHLTDELQLAAGSRILDMGCGKGRHCIMLNELGFDVTGIDLSAANIEAAKHFSRKDLNFLQHDMRVPLKGLEFDVVVNLFTSFGYFKSTEENLQVLQSAHAVLKPGGLFVLDFLNAPKAIADIVAKETKTIENTRFDIEKLVENGIIVKRIQVNNNPELVFEERVQALTQPELMNLLQRAGLEPRNTYGSYDFQVFNEQTSDRLIVIAAKP